MKKLLFRAWQGRQIILRGGAMSLSIGLKIDGLDLVSSGSFMTINDQPVEFSINAAPSGTFLVYLVFHRESHLAGRGMELKMEKEQGAMYINLYDCDSDLAVYNAKPMHIISYAEEFVERGIYLQLNLNRLRSNGAILIHYAWLVGKPPELETQVC
jgi:hypothetical protein